MLAELRRELLLRSKLLLWTGLLLVKGMCVVFGGVLLGCSAEATPPEEIGEYQAPITQGTFDEGDPGVVGLVRHGHIFCTGALISDRIVLTAAHCLDGILGRPDLELEVQTGPTLEQPLEHSAVEEAVAHPDFDPMTLVNDLALLRLAAPLPGHWWPLPDTPLAGGDLGAEVRIVGFGKTSPEDAEPPQKRQGTAVIAELAEDTFTVSPGPSQPCHLDSGGPALLSVDGEEVLVGITRSGDAACEAFGRYTRVDAYEANFIHPSMDVMLAKPLEVTGAGCAFSPPVAGTSGGLSLCFLLLVLRWRRNRRVAGYAEVLLTPVKLDMDTCIDE